MRAIAFVLSFLLLIHVPVKASDVFSDLENTLNSITTYYSEPTYFHDNGYVGIDFGTFRTFVPHRNYQLININPPSIHAGCNGIDVYAGGFSFISLDKFPQMLQQIMTAAAGYFFQLAMESLCPTCANVLALMRHASQLANKFAMDTCTMGKLLAQKAVDSKLFGDIVEKHRIDTGSDWLKSLDEKVTEFSESLDEVKNELQSWKQKSSDPKHKEYMCGNLVYLAAKRIYGDSDARLRTELIMSLLGTAVVECKTDSSDPTEPAVKAIAPTVKDVEVLVKGCRGDSCSYPGGQCSEGQVPIVTCNDYDEGCMQISYTCRSTELFSKIRDKLRNLVQDILQNRPMSEEDKVLFTSAPVFMELYNAIRPYRNDVRSVILHSYVEGLGSEAFAKLMLKETLEQTYGGVMVVTASVSFHGELNKKVDSVRRAMAERYSQIVEQLEKGYERDLEAIRQRISIYSELANLKFFRGSDAIKYLAGKINEQKVGR